MIDNLAFGEIQADGTLRFERLLPGPIEHVWDYLTRAELLGTWLWPVAIPSTPGTRFIHQHDDDGGTFEGRMRIYEPPTVLEYEWNEASAAEGPILDTVLRFELTALGDHVRLVLTHRALPRSAHITVSAGWHAHLDALLSRISDVSPVDPYERYTELEPHYANRGT